MSSWTEGVAEAADVLVSRRPVAVLTGAGISVESGIPDFRSPGGLWERFDPADYATIEAFMADPERVWRMLRELGLTVTSAEPNPGHVAIARLEALGVVAGVITQNIDDLHQRAGTRRVVDFHGNATRLVCLDCGRRLSARRVEAADGTPRCPGCDTILKPDVVFFGEAIATDALRAASELATSCGAMLVAGTSGTVAPASDLPLLARSSGAAIVEVNLEPTPLAALAEVSLRGPTGRVLPALADAVAERLTR